MSNRRMVNVKESGEWQRLRRKEVKKSKRQRRKKCVKETIEKRQMWIISEQRERSWKELYGRKPYQRKKEIDKCNA